MVVVSVLLMAATEVGIRLYFLWYFLTITQITSVQNIK